MMARVVLWLIMTLLGVGVFFWIMSSHGAIDAMLQSFGITLPDNTWVTRFAELALHLCVLVLIGLPFTLFLYSLAAVGSDQAGTDIHGYTELRLRSGTRVMTVMMVGFLVFVFAMAFGETDNIIAQALSTAGGLFFLWAGVWLLRLRVRFDQSVLLAPDYFGRMHRHEWRDLKRFSYNKEAMEYHFWFASNKRARASSYLSGVEDLIAQAQHALTR
jgi:hypothetical protein